MAKKSATEKDMRRRKSVAKFASKRAAIKAQLKDESLAFEERFKLHLKLAEMPRDGSKTRIRNRCNVSGRPRGYYRKLGMSRIALRELGNFGQVPGMVKSSW
ncbi:MAG: 30S ribosomal protein S14 [Rhizobiales bacterium]|nr:30S ribosomal protein S14 [Hyphomicrobiales bacterium]